MSTRFAVTAGVCAIAIGSVFACGHKPPKNVEPPVVETVADASDEDNVDSAPKTLFDRLGGKDAIAAVIDKFLVNVKSDPRVSKSFAKLKGDKLDHFRAMLIDQICEVTQGPCQYGGKDMKTAHKGMHVTTKQFDAVVEDLQAAMAELKVPDAEATEVVNLLAPMKEDIVADTKHGK